MAFNKCANSTPNYLFWQVRAFGAGGTVAQEIVVQQNRLMTRYCCPRGTGGDPSLWGWPALVGGRPRLMPFAYNDQNSNPVLSWQFLPVAGV